VSYDIAVSRRKKLVLALAALLALLAAYLLLWPVPVDPVAWEPPRAPALDGPYAVNDALANPEIFDLGGAGPEDIQFLADGRLCGGLEDGRIMCRTPEGALSELANTGGRPLGLSLDAAGNLVVADADKGLLSVSPAGEIAVLTTEQGGVRLAFTDDVDIASDGAIYFSDASHRWDRHHVREDMLESRPYGRLLAYDPRSQQTNLLMDGLHFANGVAVAADDSYVLVTETSRYRVRRHWLKGEKRGQSDIFIDNLPGLPDGISRGPSGRFWIALYSPRIGALDSMAASPWLRRLVYRLPRFLQPDPMRHAFVLGVDASGKVAANLQHEAPDSFSPITSVEEVGGSLYLGSLNYNGAARVPVPAVP
jgi:sugar lactone lactonase YvrE